MSTAVIPSSSSSSETQQKSSPTSSTQEDGAVNRERRKESHQSFDDSHSMNVSNHQLNHRSVGNMPNNVGERVRLENVNETNRISTSTTGEQALQDTSASSGQSPLPDELRRILEEVAETGKSSVLSWNCAFVDSGNTPRQSKRKHESMRKQNVLDRSSNSVGTKNAEGGLEQLQDLKEISREDSKGNDKMNQAGRQRNGLHPSKEVQEESNSVMGLKTHSGRKRTRAESNDGQSSSVHCNIDSEENEDDGQGETAQNDSEGTSSLHNRVHKDRSHTDAALTIRNSLGPLQRGFDCGEKSAYNSLREVVREAVSVVLNHWYATRGGYKLSPAENRTFQTLLSSGQNTGDVGECDSGEGAEWLANASKMMFRRRLESILSSLGGGSVFVNSPAEWMPPEDGPPFTIQRLAEVLVSPERYYTQTHKLCNCLEKLLLVNTSIGFLEESSARGSWESEDQKMLNSSLIRQEGTKIASFFGEMATESQVPNVDNRERDTFGDLSGRRHKERIGDDTCLDPDEPAGLASGLSPEVVRPEAMSSNEIFARASLRTKFDHVGIDPHHHQPQQGGVVGNRDSLARSNSPPPPSMGINAAAIPAGSLLRADADHSHSPLPIARPPSPLLFGNDSPSSPTASTTSPTSPRSLSPLHANSNLQLLQMNYASSLAGVSHLELMSLHGYQPPDTATRAQAFAGTGSGLSVKDADLECRSSASSDVDSESDDVSLDDSASDRSDGSDSAVVNSSEPTSAAAARAMALNRIQQQQRQQNRTPGVSSSYLFASQHSSLSGHAAAVAPVTAGRTTDGGEPNNALESRPADPDSGVE